MKAHEHALLHGLLALALAGASLSAGAQTITTVAGIAPPALSAEINQSFSTVQTAIDAAGNVYFADMNNNCIRKVTPDGFITNVAGSGAVGYSGDGGAATSASLQYPEGVAVDAAGNLYIADTYNNRIREVATNGTITTVVGNGTAGYGGDGLLFSGTNTELNRPVAVVAVGTQGELYIADINNNRIRHVYYVTSMVNGFPVTLPYIATVAGTGTAGYAGDGGAANAAELNYPSGVALDSAGNLYIADQINDRIRVVTTDGSINTIAGNGTAGYFGDYGSAINAELATPSGVAVDAMNDLYIADAFNNRIRKVGGGIITTVAGNGMQGYSGDGGSATNAQLNIPVGIAVDTSGNLYFADTLNARIRRVGTDSTISTVVGNGTLGYAVDGLSPAGYNGDNVAATIAQLNNPYATAVDSGGNIYIADEDNNRIRKIAVNGVISTVAGNGTAGTGGDGGAGINAAINSPAGVAVDGAGNLYIAEYHGHCIRKVSGTGIITTVAGTGTAGYNGDNISATSAQINYPIGIAVDAHANLYVADDGNNRIRKITGGIITTVAGNGTAGYNGDNVSATSAELNNPYAVAVDASGNLYIADDSNERIRKVATDGIITTVAGNGTAGYSGDGGPATSAEIHGPSGIAVDALGTVFIADQSNYRVRYFKPGGNISTLAGNGSAGYTGDGGAATGAEFYVPVGVTVDASDNVYIADYYNSRIRKVSGFTSDRIFANGFE